jgi:hypothetical protein
MHSPLPILCSQKERTFKEAARYQSSLTRAWGAFGVLEQLVDAVQETIHSSQSTGAMDSSQTAVQLCGHAAPLSLILITGTFDIRGGLFWRSFTGSEIQDSLEAESMSSAALHSSATKSGGCKHAHMAMPLRSLTQVTPAGYRCLEVEGGLDVICRKFLRSPKLRVCLFCLTVRRDLMNGSFALLVTSLICLPIGYSCRPLQSSPAPETTDSSSRLRWSCQEHSARPFIRSSWRRHLFENRRHPQDSVWLHLQTAWPLIGSAVSLFP